MEKLLTAPEAAALLGVKLSTIYTWAWRRQVPVQKVGRLLRFSPSALSKWLATQARAAEGTPWEEWTRWRDGGRR